MHLSPEKRHGTRVAVSFPAEEESGALQKGRYRKDNCYWTTGNSYIQAESPSGMCWIRSTCSNSLS